MKLPRVSTIGDLTVDATLLQTVSLFTNTRSSLFLFSRTRPRAHTYTHTHTHTHSLSLSSFWNSGYGAFSRGDTIIEFLARISWPRTPTVYSVTAAIFGYNVQTLIFQGKVRKCVEMRRRRDKRRQNRVVRKEETSFKNLTIFHCICIFFFLRIHFGDPWDGVANVRIPLSPSINPLLLPINRITTIKSIDWRETRQFALWKFDQKPTDECWKRVSLFFQRMQRPRRINCVTTFVKQTILSFPYYGHFSNNRGTAPQWTYEPVN